MSRRILRSLLVVTAAVGLGLAAAPAMALTISGTLGPPTCSDSDCLGVDWTLAVSDGMDAGDAPVGAGYDVHVTFVASFPSTLPIAATDIVNVEFGLPGDIDGVVATNALAMSFIGDEGPLNSNGCGGHNGNFYCATGSEPIPLSSSLTWEWDVNVSDVAAIFDPAETEDFHLGAKLTSADHPNGWLVSINPIPEPNAAAVFACGILMTVSAVRRRLH